MCLIIDMKISVCVFEREHAYYISSLTETCSRAKSLNFFQGVVSVNTYSFYSSTSKRSYHLSLNFNLQEMIEGANILLMGSLRI